MSVDHHSHNHSGTADRLRAVGLKVTKPRLAILEVLAKQHGPFTTEEIQSLLGRRSGLKADLVTIYRCLAKFESLGLISRCDFGDGSIRYELSHGDHHHHHIICRICRRVESLPACPIDSKSIRMPKTGFKDVSHRLEFFGVCPECSD